MADSASWRLDRQTRQLETITGQAGGLWRDDASKFIHERYLRPHQNQSADMSGHLKAIEQALDDIKGMLKEHQTEVQKAQENAQLVSTELEEVEQLISSASDAITRTLDHVGSSQQFDQIAHSLVMKAGSCCDGCAAETGEFRPVGAPGVFKVSANGPTPSLAAGLSQNDEAALGFYTGPSYREFNKRLRRGQPTDADRDMTKRLQAALNKLPPYKDTVFRGDEVLWERIQNGSIQVGGVYEDRAFTSSSKTFEVSENFDHRHTFVIESKTGRQLGVHSLGREQEVLFQPGTKFKVVDISYGTGTTKSPLERRLFVHMVEV